jgi:hypothetical protein
MGSAGSYFWTSYSSYDTDAGAVTTYGTDTFSTVQGFKDAHLGSGAFSFLLAMDEAGSLVLASDDNGLQIFPAGGGPGTTFDTSPGATGALTADGKNVVYANETSLLRSPTAAPAPSVLASGKLDVYALSPNGQSVLLYVNSTMLGVASALTPGAVTPITTTTDLGFFWYTADSSRVVYLTGYDVGGSGTGTLNAFAVGGTAGNVLGQGVASWRAATGSKVVFDNLANQAADIKVVDVAGSTGASVVVRGAHPTWLLSPTHDQIVYSWSQTLGPEAGIYVTPVP